MTIKQIGAATAISLAGIAAALAIGVRIRRWVTFHGISLNIEPDLSHFSGIVPCGVRAHGVTSLVDLGIPITMPEVDSVLRVEFERFFGPTALVL
jgi:lipoyl(octanoyl) transferase